MISKINETSKIKPRNPQNTARLPDVSVLVYILRRIPASSSVPYGFFSLLF